MYLTSHYQKTLTFFLMTDLNVKRGKSTHKLIIAVREDLRMTAGKAGSQCAHAAVGALRIASEENKLGWQESCEPIVVLAAYGQQHIESLYQIAVQFDLPVYVWKDASHTQSEMAIPTAIALGPAPSSEIDELCIGLKLYK